MKMKLAAFLAATMLALAGCGGASNTGTTNTTNGTNTTNRTGNATSTTATPDPNVVKANANASAETGGTKEGCKCSAAGMKCSTEPGEKGCCGAKDGACCSAAGKMAAGEGSCNPEAKPAATATKKS